MGSFGIVPEEMLDQSHIEGNGVEKLGLVVIHKLFLDGAIEPFGMSIHLRGLWVGVPVLFVESFHLGVKVLHKLTAVVGEDVLKREWKQEGDKLKELLGRLTGMARGGPCE